MNDKKFADIEARYHKSIELKDKIEKLEACLRDFDEYDAISPELEVCDSGETIKLWGDEEYRILIKDRIETLLKLSTEELDKL